MAPRHEGHVAIVTGAGSGIGRATSMRLAREGATVIACDINPDTAEQTAAAIREAGGQAEARTADVTDSGQVDALISGTVETHGRIDVFHSNAGFGAAHAPLADVSDDAWAGDLTLNLTSMFYVLRAAAPAMAATGGGAIVCTSSGAGLGFVANTGPYGAAKAAILQLVRTAAVEFGASGVRVNAVIPGAVKTPAFMGYIGTEERLAAYEKQIPVGHACTPDDIASAVSFLASDEAASITGTSLVVDGGVAARRDEPRIGVEL